ncbi:hypothetical protein OHB12_02485 [Nocardia sp. NBC_01730]|uniref:hypothetical protein n=1 Tax=Nocardia sp. NBC_01730 TaxID=2975998 RepID=UPI002E146BD7|nr:hypothetical protein OHB12_02485 [Nocardia sp. NBC_01730]
MAERIEVDLDALQTAASYGEEVCDGIASFGARLKDILGRLPEACGTGKPAEQFLEGSNGEPGVEESGDATVEATDDVHKSAMVMRDAELDIVSRLEQAEEASTRGFD